MSCGTTVINLKINEILLYKSKNKYWLSVISTIKNNLFLLFVSYDVYLTQFVLYNLTIFLLNAVHRHIFSVNCVKLIHLFKEHYSPKYNVRKSNISITEMKYFIFNSLQVLL